MFLIALFLMNIFSYDLNVTKFPGREKEVMIGMHGMGGDYRLGEVLHANQAIPFQVVTFDFPKSGFGSLDEILPALSVWKQVIVDGKLDKVHLYGFSAGGGAIINALAVLNGSQYDNELQKIGIGPTEKKQILDAIQSGTVILEAPLKSFDEIPYYESTLIELAKTARNNGMVPIQNIDQLVGLKLNIFVYFATPDEVLTNRDDQLFIDRLKNVNSKGRLRRLWAPQKNIVHIIQSFGMHTKNVKEFIC